MTSHFYVHWPFKWLDQWLAGNLTNHRREPELIVGLTVGTGGGAGAFCSSSSTSSSCMSSMESSTSISTSSASSCALTWPMRSRHRLRESSATHNRIFSSIVYRNKSRKSRVSELNRVNLSTKMGEQNSFRRPFLVTWYTWCKHRPVVADWGVCVCAQWTCCHPRVPMTPVATAMAERRSSAASAPFL